MSTKPGSGVVEEVSCLLLSHFSFFLMIFFFWPLLSSTERRLSSLFGSSPQSLSIGSKSRSWNEGLSGILGELSLLSFTLGVVTFFRCIIEHRR